MTQTVAYLEAVVGADITSFRKGMQEVRRSILDVGGLAGGLQNVGKSMTLALTLPLLGLAGAALKASADFEASMRNVASISDDVAGNFDEASQQVLDFGSSIRSGPMAAAEALYTVVSSGITNMKDAMTISQIAAATAEAGLANLTTTTEALTGAMLAYNAPIQDAQHYSDVLTRTVQLGVGSMDSFTTAFSNATGTSALMGMSIDDLGAALAMISQRGIKATSAGTYMNSMLTGLIKPNTALTAVFKELGVATGSDLLKKFGGLNGAIQAIGAVSGTTETAIFSLFNDLRARKAAAALMQDLEVTSQVFKDFGASVDGATDRARQEQMKSFNAHVDLMTSALTGLGITIGEKLQPFLMPLVDGLSAIFLSAKEIDGPIMAMVIAFGLAVAAIGPLVWILGTLLTPMGLVFGIVAGLGTAYATNFGGVRDAITGAVDAALPSLGKLSQAIQDFFSIVFMPTGGSGGHSPNPQQLQDSMNPANAAWNSDMMATNPGYTPNDFAPKATTNGSVSMGDRISAALKAEGPKVIAAFESLKLEISAWFTGKFLPGLDTWGGDILNRIALSILLSKNTTPFSGPLSDVMNTSIGEIKIEDGKITTALKGLVTAVEGWVVRVGIPDVGRAFSMLFKGASDALLGTTKTSNEDGMLIVDQLIPGGIGDTISKFGASLTKPLNDLKGVLDTITAPIGEGLGNLATGIKGFSDALAGTDLSGVVAIALKIATFVGVIGAAVAAVGGAAVGGLLDGIGAMLPGLGAAVKSFFDAVNDLASGDLNKLGIDLGNFVTSLYNAASLGVDTFLLSLADNLGKLIGLDVKGGIGAWAGIFANLTVAIQTKLAEALQVIQNFIRDANITMLELNVTLGLKPQVELDAAYTQRAIDTAMQSFNKQGIYTPGYNGAGGGGGVSAGAYNSMLLVQMGVKIVPTTVTTDPFTPEQMEEVKASLIGSAGQGGAGGGTGSGNVTAGMQKTMSIDIPITLRPVVADGKGKGSHEGDGASDDIFASLKENFEASIGESGVLTLQFAAFAALIAAQTGGMSMNIAGVGVALVMLSVTAMALKSGIVKAFVEMGIGMAAGLNPVIGALNTIKNLLAGLSGVNVTVTGGGAGGGKTYASGGGIGPEGGFIGGRGMEFLAPGENGTIIPTRAIRDALRNKGGGDGDGGNTYVIYSYGQSPYDLVELIEQTKRNMGA